MSKQEWIRLGYSEADAEELSKLAETYPGTNATYKNIDEATEGLTEEFKKIEKMMKERVYEARSGDVLYCNTKFIEELGHPYELKLGWTLDIYEKDGAMVTKGVIAKVIEIHSKKKYPNKKWWQFWLKQEEYVDGYNLMIL